MGGAGRLAQLEERRPYKAEAPSAHSGELRAVKFWAPIVGPRIVLPVPANYTELLTLR